MSVLNWDIYKLSSYAISKKGFQMHLQSAIYEAQLQVLLLQGFQEGIGVHNTLRSKSLPR